MLEAKQNSERVQAEATELSKAAIKEAEKLVAKATSRKARRAVRKQQASSAAQVANDVVTDDAATIDVTKLDENDLTAPQSAPTDDSEEKTLVYDLRDAWTAPE